MSAIESRPTPENVNLPNLTGALQSALSDYRRGRDTRVAAIRVYSGMDLVAQDSKRRLKKNPLRTFAEESAQSEPQSFVLQNRTVHMQYFGSIGIHFDRFESGGVGMLVKSTISKQERPREIGLLYLHLSGLMIDGYQFHTQGFANSLPTFKDMVRADYLYQRGTLMLGEYLYGKRGSNDFWGRETKLRGMRKAKGQRQGEIVGGMFADRGRMESVITGSRPYALEAWQNFLEKGVYSSDERDVAESVANSYRKQIEYDQRMNEMFEADFSRTSPAFPFAFMTGPRDHRGRSIAKNMIGQVEIPTIR